jgi:hypothetical protein
MKRLRSNAGIPLSDIDTESGTLQWAGESWHRGREKDETFGSAPFLLFA